MKKLSFFHTPINLLWRITMQGILNRINDVLVLQNGIRNYRIR